MQKTNKKKQNHTSHIALHTSQKGITLIALIITIIVMLILVGVTINVALNGGLFSKADEASKQMQIEAEKEELLSAVVAAIGTDGKVDINYLDNHLPTEEWSGTKGIYTSPKRNTFTVTAEGKIIEGVNGEIDKEETPEVENPESGTTPIVPNLPQELELGTEFQMDADKNGTEETWIVLYAETASHLNEGEIEIISKNTMGELALGKNDTEAIENATDIDGDGTVEDIEIAIYSYNNAIDRINNYASSLIKIDNLGVRSVGSLPSNPSNRNTSKPLAIENLDSWADKTGWNIYGVLGEIGEKEVSNLDEDLMQMESLGIEKAGDSKRYWFASRAAYEDWNKSSFKGSVSFNVKYADTYGDQGNFPIWSVKSDGTNETTNWPWSVRPVIKLQYLESSN